MFLVINHSTLLLVPLWEIPPLVPMRFQSCDAMTFKLHLRCMNYWKVVRVNQSNQMIHDSPLLKHISSQHHNWHWKQQQMLRVMLAICLTFLVMPSRAKHAMWARCSVHWHCKSHNEASHSRLRVFYCPVVKRL